MTTLHVKLFGTFTIQRNDQINPHVPSRRVKDLLSYLLLTRGTRHARAHLAGLFWGDQEEQKAKHCLNTALWRLNRLLGSPPPGAIPYLYADAQYLGFNPTSDISVDVVEFETRCQLAASVGGHAPEHEATLYRDAVQLYTADLLPDCYDDWCLIERERLQQLYLRALTHLMSFHSERGEHDDTARFAKAILGRDSLREDVHRDLIAALLAGGRAAAALQQYQSCEALLRDELGIAPMPETRALLATILAHTTAASRKPAATLPAAATRLGDLHVSSVVANALEQVRVSLAALEQAREDLQRARDALEQVSELSAMSRLQHANGLTIVVDA